MVHYEGWFLLSMSYSGCTLFPSRIRFFLIWGGDGPYRVLVVVQVVSPSLSADDGGVGATGLFRKLYDAYPSDNALSGTCMAGQLLDEGYEQEQANGR